MIQIYPIFHALFPLTVTLMQWYYMYNKRYPDMETLDRKQQGI